NPVSGVPMSTVAPTRPRRKASRSVRLHMPPFGTGAGRLTITVGGTAEDYSIVRLIATFGGPAFRLTKLLNGNSYDVHLDGPCSTCECLGHQRWGGSCSGGSCKHIAALTALVESGRL